MVIYEREEFIKWSATDLFLKNTLHGTMATACHKATKEGYKGTPLKAMAH